MTEGKRKLAWCRVRKNIRFLILFIPRSSDCKNLFTNFRKFHYTTILMNLHHFSYFDPNKKFISIPYWLRSVKKSKKYAHCWSIGLIKSKIVKASNHFIPTSPINIYPPSQNLNFFLGHLNANTAKVILPTKYIRVLL